AELFPIAARFNHACFTVNNIEYRFHEEKHALKIVVRRDIAAGRELKISYGKSEARALVFVLKVSCGCGGCKGLSERDIEVQTCLEGHVHPLDPVRERAHVVQ
ncbi:hypothetical protein CCMA1212_008911, partial [Trichoderma ghanense]